ncbi:mediator complex, subunit Med21 [Geopyxis carbonaria]|nr:mediator complex, subunit Med21 [Geopyxis carbonaria]
MTDRLTQLQDAVDQMATQCFSALRYINDHHDYVPLSGEPKVTPDEGITIDDPATFQAAQTELARDLIVKCKQVEVLITSLPGIGVSEEEQEGRLRNLEAMAREAEEERKQAAEERERAREKLEKVLANLRRV